LSLASPGTPIVFKMSSFNESSIQNVDVFVSYLPATVPPAAAGAGTATFANFVAPTAGAGVINEVADSGNAPVTISYTRYDQLINGRNSTTGATFTPLSRVLLRSVTSLADFSVTLTELATAAGVTLPGASTVVMANQPAFLLTFVVTLKNGKIYSYINSGPGVTLNPANGRLVTRFFTGNDAVSGLPVTNRSYGFILSGEEGSPFIPGVSIRVAP
jgi:hypothetical protein